MMRNLWGYATTSNIDMRGERVHFTASNGNRWCDRVTSVYHDGRLVVGRYLVPLNDCEKCEDQHHDIYLPLGMGDWKIE